MFVGVLRLVLYMPDPGSLKSKRHLVRSAIERVKSKFNVSIAEVGDNELWQKSVLGVAAVGNDHAFVNETLDKVTDFLVTMHGGQIELTDRAMEITPYGEELGQIRTLAEAEADAEAEARAEAEALREMGAEELAPAAAAAHPEPGNLKARIDAMKRSGGKRRKSGKENGDGQDDA